jgi:hypothetical protein
MKFRKSLSVWQQPRYLFYFICLISSDFFLLQIQAAFNEFAVTGTRQDRTFEYAGYSKIYANFYMMQLAINKDLKHTTKTKALRVEWASSVRQVS